MKKIVSIIAVAIIFAFFVHSENKPVVIHDNGWGYSERTPQNYVISKDFIGQRDTDMIFYPIDKEKYIGKKHHMWITPKLSRNYTTLEDYSTFENESLKKVNPDIVISFYKNIESKNGISRMFKMEDTKYGNFFFSAFVKIDELIFMFGSATKSIEERTNNEDSFLELINGLKKSNLPTN